jgi:hypothetical protein
MLAGTCRISTRSKTCSNQVAEIPLSGYKVFLLFCNAEIRNGALDLQWERCTSLPVPQAPVEGVDDHCIAECKHPLDV